MGAAILQLRSELLARFDVPFGNQQCGWFLLRKLFEPGGFGSFEQLTAAILDASRYIDVMANRKKVSEIIADKSYVNCPVDVIDQRLEGNYDNGIGKTWKDPNYMKFYNDGYVNFPHLSDGMWFLTQHKRWGLLKEDPDYLAVAKQVNQIELYKQIAAQVKVHVPASPMRTSKLIDGVVWDGKDPKAYANGFKIKV